MKKINVLLQFPIIKTLGYFWISLYKHFHFNFFAFGMQVAGFFNDFFRYRMLATNTNQQISIGQLMPMLTDKTTTTPIEPIYYFQDTWACGQLFGYKPKKHYDVGSHATTVGIMSQFVPTTFIDIRPIDLKLNNLTFLEGDITKLPLKSNSVESFSSLCVLEHIGLGRYGDPLDQFGTEKAILEIIRVLKKGGHLLFSVPVHSTNKTFFNAHRAFSREYILSLFLDFAVLDERYIYGRKLYSSYSKQKGFGVGLYHLQKR